MKGKVNEFLGCISLQVQKIVCTSIKTVNVQFRTLRCLHAKNYWINFKRLNIIRIWGTAILWHSFLLFIKSGSKYPTQSEIPPSLSSAHMTWIKLGIIGCYMPWKCYGSLVFLKQLCCTVLGTVEWYKYELVLSSSSM